MGSVRTNSGVAGGDFGLISAELVPQKEQLGFWGLFFATKQPRKQVVPDREHENRTRPTPTCVRHYYYYCCDYAKHCGTLSCGNIKRDCKVSLRHLFCCSVDGGSPRHPAFLGCGVSACPSFPAVVFCIFVVSMPYLTLLFPSRGRCPVSTRRKPWGSHSPDCGSVCSGKRRCVS